MVRSASGNWDGIRLHVFDVPQAQGNLYQRLETASKWLKSHPSARFTVIPQVGRNGQLLKLKSEYDDECTVTRHYEGKGRNVGRLGAVGCKNRYGEFRIGSGFKDKDRDHPPKIGALITYRYRGFTQKGTPKFATFVRVRSDR